MNREAMRSLLIFLLAWVVIAAVATYALRRAPRIATNATQFEVPVYPGARNLRREGSAEIRWLVVTYELDARPPATAVIEYYRQQLPPRGWLPVKRTHAMEWQRRGEESPTDVLWRQWVTKDELLRFDLGLSYVRGTEAMPGRMTVRAAVTRNLPITPGRGSSRQRHQP